MGMLQLEQDLAMPLVISVAAEVILLREEEEGEKVFGREGDVSSGCSMEKALRCLITGYGMDVRIPPASLSACEPVLKSQWGSGVQRLFPELQLVRFGGGGLPWAALPWGGAARGCPGGLLARCLLLG